MKPTSADFVKRLANAVLLLLISILVLSSISFLYNPFSKRNSTLIGNLYSENCKEKNYIAFNPYNYAMVDYIATHRDMFFSVYCLYTNGEEEKMCDFYVMYGFYDRKISIKQILSQYPSLYEMFYNPEISVKNIVFLNINCMLSIFNGMLKIEDTLWM